MKNHFALKFLRALLNISQFFAGLFSLMFMIEPFVHKFTIQTTIYLLVCLIYFMIIYNLRKILSSTDSTPFCADNVKRFRSIGYYMIAISISDAIINYRIPSHFILLGNENASLKGSFLIYLVITCMAFVLAEIFEKAVILKNEHDLTI